MDSIKDDNLPFIEDLNKLSDPVNRPIHYRHGKIEVIEFIEDQKFSYHRGNAVKYICRAGKKDPLKEVEDLQKAIWYLEREVKSLKENANRII